MEIIRLEGHSSHVNKVKFSPHGDYILTAGFNGELYLWDRVSLERVQLYEGHNQTVNSIQWLKEGQEFISASGDGTITHHELSSTKPKATWQDLKSGVSHMHFSYDYQYLLTSNKTTMLRVREWPDGDLVHKVKSDQQNSGVLTTSQTNSHAIIGGVGTRLRRCMIPSGEILEEMEGHEQATMGFEFFDQDLHGVSIGYDGSLILWDMKTHQVLEKYKVGDPGYYSLAISQNEKEVAIAMPFLLKRIQLQDLSVEEIKLPSKGNYSVDYSPNGEQLVVASADKSVRVIRL
ncbi:WD40 repeat domain-containing protein [Halobacillus seohaensis]|uniref:WD40 repeat domain-containing protein n=1 Tax=Halobacillus seohaensis TaxID=447421 RepID=A0ABW2ERM1_9BACI